MSSKSKNIPLSEKKKHSVDDVVFLASLNIGQCRNSKICIANNQVAATCTNTAMPVLKRKEISRTWAKNIVTVRHVPYKNNYPIGNFGDKVPLNFSHESKKNTPNS